tara:strand:- start:1109 stop:2248 length:1140 start_codon:yes stop_codon:yes gene_type:complete
MANVIKLKRGSGSDPAASDLVVGEIAIRSDTGKLFTKKDNGSVAEISGSGGGASNFFINTLSSSSGSGGGSASFNGTATRFTLSNPPSVAAQQLLVSINGVIQKPNSGTSPSEGFAIDGADIIFASAPVTGAGFFIITYAELAVGVPSDNSVTSAKIADGAIVNGDVSSTAAIAGTKIAPDFGSQNIVTTGTLASGNHTVDGDMTLTGANYNVLWDKSDNALEFADNAKAIFGTGSDLQIYHDGSNSRIHSPSHSLFIRTGNVAGFFNGDGTEDILKGTVNGAVELYFDNGKKAETVTGGFTVTGVCTATSFAGDGSSLTGISAGATGGGSDEVFYENSTTVTTSYSITSNKNAMSAGPLSINSGAVVTIPSGSVWTIV